MKVGLRFWHMSCFCVTVRHYHYQWIARALYSLKSVAWLVSLSIKNSTIQRFRSFPIRSRPLSWFFFRCHIKAHSYKRFAGTSWQPNPCHIPCDLPAKHHQCYRCWEIRCIHRENHASTNTHPQKKTPTEMIKTTLSGFKKYITRKHSSKSSTPSRRYNIIIQ